MDQSTAQKLVVKIGIAILLVALVDLVYLNWWVLKGQGSEVRDQRSEQARTIDLVPSPSPEASPSPSLTPSPTTIVEKETIVREQTQTIVQTSQKEIFIPIGTGSTLKQTYTELSGAQVTVDTSKYGSIEAAYFEASIRVEGGNGKASVQLYNKTLARPIWFSELANSTSTSTYMTSPKITLDSGSNSYVVQAKTAFENWPAYVDSSRIRIILK